MLQTIKLWDALPDVGHQMTLEIFRQAVRRLVALVSYPPPPSPRACKSTVSTHSKSSSVAARGYNRIHMTGKLERKY